MLNRLRLLKGASALLYFGPLLAGLGGFGWSVIPVFTAIFLLWLVVLKPGLWPRSIGEWMTGPALLALAARTATQLLFVAICFGIGRGIGGVMGYRPSLPVMLPVGLSLVAIPLGRMIWNPADAEETDPALDRTLSTLRRSTDDPSTAAQRTAALDAAGPVLAAAPDLPDDSFDALVRAAATAAGPAALAEALFSVAETRPAALRALVHLTTDPTLAGDLAETGQQAHVFRLIGRDDALLRSFALRGVLLLESNAQIWFDMPSTELVRAAATAAGPTAAEALSILAEAQDRAAPDGHA